MSHPLVARLQSRDPEERRAACEAAPNDPSAVLLVDAVCSALGDEDRAVARSASRALTRLTDHRDSVREALISALAGDDPRRRLFAALTWVHVERPHLRCLPALVEALADGDGDLRWTAARALVDLARLQPEVHGVLLALTRDDGTPRVRRMALHALRELAPDDPDTASALLAASRADNAALRRSALTSLAGLTAPPAAVLERLRDALDEDDAATQRIAARAIERLEPPDPSPKR